MAKLADSEAVVWRQAENIRQLRAGFLRLEKVLAVLARRQGGELLISPEEMARLPSGTVIRCSQRDDGDMEIQAVTGENGARSDE